SEGKSSGEWTNDLIPPGRRDLHANLKDHAHETVTTRLPGECCTMGGHLHRLWRRTRPARRRLFRHSYASGANVEHHTTLARRRPAALNGCSQNRQGGGAAAGFARI